MRRNSAKFVALGGVTAALAVVIMCLGGLIPVATYVCPMLCCLLLFFVNMICGKKISWAWYAAVSVINLLLAPDKEAAIVFFALGYYPIIKSGIDRMKLQWLVKFLLFNGASAAAYGILIYVMGVDDLSLGGMGTALIVILILLGNLTFYLLDRLLGILSFKFRRRK